MAKLSTHILDTSAGRPADSVAIRLYSVDEQRVLLVRAVTNSDGRTDDALLEGEALRTGAYELEFDMGDYFRGRGDKVAEPAFLETVVIRFSMRADEAYHVPLLASPWSYSTYRGS